MNRRKFLKIAGSTAVIIGAGAGSFLATRTPTDALRPWKDAATLYSDPMRRALSYAILAPNPHNRQPWIVDLINDREAVLTCDLERLLLATDPYSRQIVIGLGCFLELFSIAAAEDGYHADISYFPEGEIDDRLDHRPIARLSLRKSSEVRPDPLFAHVLDRHTNRNPYDTERPIADDIIERLKGAGGGSVQTGATNKGKLLEFLRTMTRDAMIDEIKTPEAYQESVDLMRIGRSEIEANPDGISLGGAFLETLSLTGVLSRQSVADTASSSYQIALDMTEEGAMASMGFVWVTTSGNDRAAQIEAGRAYLRIALHVAADGLVMQPMSQALQEYAEMAAYFKIAHEKLAKPAGGRVQMLARLGYADDVGPAPRWPLETRMKKS